MNSSEGKSILALIRGAAFAHAGETEAIEMALGEVPKDDRRAVLDAGCGLGGTADYVQRNGWGRVTGFDIDAVSAESARTNFPECTFVAADVGTVGGIWPAEFDLIYCFNTVYAFPDQSRALAELGKAARPGAQLIICDYTDPRLRYARSAFAARKDATSWQPLHPPTLKDWAGAVGWQMVGARDISSDYVQWYNALVGSIEKKRGEVIAAHGEEAFLFVHLFYVALRDAIADGTLGGAICAFQRI